MSITINGWSHLIERNTKTKEYISLICKSSALHLGLVFSQGINHLIICSKKSKTFFSGLEAVTF